MRYEVPIPPIYLDLTNGYTMRATIFKGYVEGYIKRNYPRLNLIRIDGMKAICEVKEGWYEEREKAKQETKPTNKRGRSKSK